jgi:phenylacetate-CoA ligase
MIVRTPLDVWAAKKIGLNRGTLTRDLLDEYQRVRMMETIRFVIANSSFYRTRLRQYSAQDIATLGQLADLPFTSAEDLRFHSSEFLCVPQSHISRVVTLETSGTVGPAKRIWFTPDDQALTVDFFCAGMSTFVEAGDKVLILLPGERPGSVGDLLAQALKTMKIEAIRHGTVYRLEDTLRIMCDNRIQSVVGTPVQVLALARYSVVSEYYPLKLKSVLLSTDHAAKSLIHEIEKLWRCQVFDHYGMTEMGLGGGVECSAHDGFHLREADLYFEIIDPNTGAILPEGCEGELVFSTLNRHGMPLIRYRTGDITRFLPGKCGCGSVMKRLGKIIGRVGESVLLAHDAEVRMSMLDEVMFAIPGIIDFSVELHHRPNKTRVDLFALVLGKEINPEDVLEQVARIPQVAAAVGEDRWELGVHLKSYTGSLLQVRAKRRIREVMSNG